MGNISVSREIHRFHLNSQFSLKPSVLSELSTGKLYNERPLAEDSPYVCGNTRIDDSFAVEGIFGIYLVFVQSHGRGCICVLGISLRNFNLVQIGQKGHLGPAGSAGLISKY